MRHFQLKRSVVHVVIIISLCFITFFAFAGPKGKAVGHDKISPGLAKVLEYYQADKNFELPVIVQVDPESFHPHGAPPGLVKGLVEEEVLGLVQGYSGKMSVKDIQQLEHSRFIKYVSLDASVHATSNPLNSSIGVEQTLDSSGGASNLLGHNGAGVAVAVFDSGVADHPDLSRSVSELDLSNVGQLGGVNGDPSGTTYTDPLGLGWDLSISTYGSDDGRLTNNVRGIGIRGNGGRPIGVGEAIEFEFTPGVAISYVTIFHGLGAHVQISLDGVLQDGIHTIPDNLPNVIQIEKQGSSLLISNEGAAGDDGFRVLAVGVSSTTFVSVDFTSGAAELSYTYDDGFGHGTHVSGIIGGKGRGSNGQYSGVAPKAEFVHLKVLDNSGIGSTSHVIQAMEWAIQNKDVYNIRVANLSLGHPAFESYLNDPLCQAARRMVEAGIVTVVSAGNLGKTAGHPELWGGITSPGTEPSVITVGAANTKGTATHADDVATSYSSRGYTIPDQLFKPDLVAPGNRIPSLSVPGHIKSTYPSLQIGDDYISLSGSSMATAFVSGAAAIMLDANPDLTPNLVKTILLVTATKMDQPHMFEQGNGFLNAYTAVKLAEQVDVANHDLLGDVPPMWILDGENGPEEVWAGGAFVWGQRVLYSDLVTPNSGFWGDSVVWSDNLFGPESVLWADTFFNPGSVIWSDFFNSVVWSDFFDSVIWADTSFDPESVIWSDFFDSVIWADFLDSVIWADNFDSVVWADFFDSVVWADFLDSVIWADYFDSVIWADFFDSVVWSDFFDSVIWADFFDSVIWADGFFDPGSVIWADFFDSVVWADSVIWTDDPANSTEGD